MNNQMIKCTEWSHPDWDMTLILPDDDSRGRPQDFLLKEQAEDKLVVEDEYEMSEDQLDTLPEFSG